MNPFNLKDEVIAKIQSAPYCIGVHFEEVPSNQCNLPINYTITLGYCSKPFCIQVYPVVKSYDRLIATGKAYETIPEALQEGERIAEQHHEDMKQTICEYYESIEHSL